MTTTKKEDENIDLLSLIPQDAIITLYVQGEPQEFALRAISLEDEAWLSRSFGDQIQAIFEQLKMEEICKIVFHQLVDKGQFKACEEKDYDDDGNEITRLVKGHEHVMRSIKGKRHQIEIVQSLLQTIGWSRPILSDAEEAEVKSKKKRTPKKAQTKPTGAQSTTS